MKTSLLISILTSFIAGTTYAHSWKAGDSPVEREALRAHIMEEWLAAHSEPASEPTNSAPAQLASTTSSLSMAAAVVTNAANAPATARPFLSFPKLQVKWDKDSIYIGSNGMPDHKMMIGITAWQQQVPLPQAYFGGNAWRIPLHPVPASTPAMVDGRFLRGAIALAVNGIPIFNPQNNRGEISYEIGELDQWGGHCGRADDYHYHIAPLHLQSVVGKGMPVAFALDGYPIYGLTEPNGSVVGKLDECHGHEAAGIGYHYHAAMKYPYVIGGFHGQITEAGDQVDPQPRAQPVREALPALRGAEITGFESTGRSSYKLSYKVSGDPRSVAYSINPDGTHPFEFDNGRDGKSKETYTARQGGGGKGSPGGPGGKGKGKGKSGPGRDMRQGDSPPSTEPKERTQSVAAASPDQPRSSNDAFLLTSPAVENGAEMPAEYTGDGSGATLPLAWKGVPAGTQSFALIMDHTDLEGAKKWYWTLYDLPASLTSLPKNVQGVGKVGTGFRGRVGYEPPHSKGPGPKTYVITLYALSAPMRLNQSPESVNRAVLLDAMKGKVLASSSLSVVHTSQGATGAAAQSGGADRPPQTAIRDRRDAPSVQLVQNTNAQPAERRGGEGKGAGGKGKGKGKGGPPGLIKPGIADTIKLNVYADNWFMLYVNGRLVAVDPIQFTPHNVVSVDFLPEYPMTIAVLAKDNADTKTGLEYGSSIGDGGFILKFGDGTVTNATWKAKSFFHGPVNGDTSNPQVKQEPLPANWWSTDFDDRTWAKAKEYTVEEVDPKQPYFENDFEGAKFIWTNDIALDNTIIFRTRIEKPDWKQRWNTKPDLDVKGAPLQ